MGDDSYHTWYILNTIEVRPPSQFHFNAFLIDGRDRTDFFSKCVNRRAWQREKQVGILLIKFSQIEKHKLFEVCQFKLCNVIMMQIISNQETCQDIYLSFQN